MEPLAAAASPATAALTPCYIFTAGVRFAVPQAWLWRVHRVEELTPMPRTAPYLAGVAMILQHVVACLDLARLNGSMNRSLGRSAAGAGAGLRGPFYVAVVELLDMRAGLLSTEVGFTAEVNPTVLKPLPPWLAEGLGPAAQGLVEIAGGPAVLLDVPFLLSTLAPRPTTEAVHGG